jgi:hypothetical protein
MAKKMLFFDGKGWVQDVNERFPNYHNQALCLYQLTEATGRECSGADFLDSPKESISNY